MIVPIKKLTLAFIIFVLSFSASAHDFWIEAKPHNAAQPQKIEISLHVGTEYVGDAVPNIPDWYSDFSYVHANKRLAVAGNMGDDPAGAISANADGLYLVGYQNYPEFIDLDAQKFNEYLKEEGLDHVLAHRQRNNTLDDPVSEYYQRCVKALIKVGNKEIAQSDLSKPLGYDLEINPVTSPYDSKSVTVSVSYLGKPLANSLVIAFTKQSPHRKQKMRSDQNGQVKIDLTQSGSWIIKTVHMVPYQNAGADWISYWASLTFQNY